MDQNHPHPAHPDKPGNAPVWIRCPSSSSHRHHDRHTRCHSHCKSGILPGLAMSTLPCPICLQQNIQNPYFPRTPPSCSCITRRSGLSADCPGLSIYNLCCHIPPHTASPRPLSIYNQRFVWNASMIDYWRQLLPQ